ncbi:MAG: tRNA (N6-isopentenyl adenosine(37)-C2)-methylthiotransferase MiaB, partial [Pseudomonadota bacterium]|nr:tRNA (N6-isopentenyl adenosine(37)-C2)-methylthiotransferase MiaB [Pseudomonadota bacterium]
MTHTLYIKTWGCQMNVYDSARIADLMAAHGYTLTSNPVDASLIVLNTCHIRDKATEKVYSKLGRLNKIKRARAKKGLSTLIAVGGCVGQAEGDEIVARAPYVDIVFGPQVYHRLPEMIRQSKSGHVIDTDFPVESKFDHLPDEVASQGAAAYLAIQEGCDNFCTYCVVPYTRGPAWNRPANDILDEARKWTDRGAREIILLGQNVNTWKSDGQDGKDWRLGRLLFALAEAHPDLRLRYITSHPSGMDDADLPNAHAEIPGVMPFLHLPVQSGSDSILKAMNRKHGRDHYLAIIDRFRSARPDIAIGSDFIAGFPGETEKDFADTLDLVDRVGFAQGYSFKYSPRPGTPAAALRYAVPEEIKTERLTRLQTALWSHQLAFNKSCLGLEMDVLFERSGNRQGQVLGRSPYMQSVYVKS